MKSKASRWTRQLQVIMDIVYSSEFNLTADKVYAEARKKIANISLGTVYRNLNKLALKGYIAIVQTGPQNCPRGWGWRSPIGNFE
jgi:Fe2+ or Zn2+ uptake regulation protein